MAALITAVSSTPSISVFDTMEAVELVQRDGRVAGVHASRAGQPGRASFLPARAVVLADGGAGQLDGVTTNPKEANGAGLGMAARAGAAIADPEVCVFIRLPSISAETPRRSLPKQYAAMARSSLTAAGNASC